MIIIILLSVNLAMVSNKFINLGFWHEIQRVLEPMKNCKILRLFFVSIIAFDTITILWPSHAVSLLMESCVQMVVYMEKLLQNNNWYYELKSVTCRIVCRLSLEVEPTLMVGFDMLSYCSFGKYFLTFAMVRERVVLSSM